MIRRATLIVAASLGVWTALLGGESPAGSDLHKKLEVYASARVYRVEVGKGRGTAVLMEADPDDGIAYFVTAYHVLQGADRMTLSHIDHGVVASDRDVLGVYRRVSEDLAVLKVQLPKGRSFDSLGANPAIVPDCDGPESVEAEAVGFAPTASDRPFDSRVRIYGTRTASFLRINDPTWIPPPGEESAGLLKLRVLGSEATLHGMSGGLVVDSELRFGGIVFGRMPDAVNLMIPAGTVLAAVHAAKRPDALKPFAPELFEPETPFTADIRRQLALPYVEDPMDWRFFDKWSLLFADDPTPFITSFQEVVLDLPAAEVRPLHLDILDRSHPGGRLGGAPEGRSNHHVTLWLNGERFEDAQAKSLDLHLIPGENLLVITKAIEGSPDLDLRGLFDANPIAAEFRLGEETIYVLERSLPAIVSGYPVYVTIRNGSVEDGLDPYNARLAVRRDFLEDLVNRVPFWVPVRFGPTPEGSIFEGRMTFEGNDFGRVAYRSPQTFDLTAKGKIKIEQGRFSGYGIRLEAEPRELAVNLRGRLQFPTNREEWIYISARALGASGRDPFKVPLIEGGEGRLGLSLDIGGILRELLVCQVNNSLLLPDDPESPAAEKVGRFFGSLGLTAAVPDWHLRPQQVVMSRDGEHDWIVFTFRAFKGDPPPRGAPVPDGHQPPLLPDLDARPNQIIEFVAHGVPGASASRFAPPAPRDPMLDRALELARVETLILSADEPADAARKDAAPTPIDDDGEKIAARFQAVFAERLAEARKVVEVQIDPAPALGLLQGCIQRPRLNLSTRGRVVAAAATGPDGTHVTLRHADGPLIVEAREPIEFPGGPSFDGLSLSVDRIEVRGQPDSSRATGSLEGRLGFDRARSDDVEIRDARCRFEAKFDTAGPEILTFECTPTGGDFRYKSAEFQPLPDIRLRIVVGKEKARVIIKLK